ncbi:MAG TPA: hypothetical protein VGR71_02165, partial [Nitrospira sp.]|nr:hypothetical protein [Nitrospira sp.]
MRSLRPCAKVALVALAGVGAPGLALADGWTFTPSMSGQELATDNLLETPTHTRSDFVTTLSPGFSLTEDSERVQGTLDYSPSLYYYALTPSQNTIGHNLYANGTATVIPDFAFFDLRAFAAMQPTTPGLTTSPIATTPSISLPAFTNVSGGLPSVQLSQDYSFSASPYIGRRFDDFGAVELRYTFADTQINNNSKASPAVPAGFANQSSSDRTNEVTATFNTGERFGLYEGRVLLDGAKSSGTGGLNQSSSYVATIDSAYRVTPRIAPLSTIGYEAIEFNGFPPIRINDVIWGIGVRLTPSSDLTINVRYGHANGITAPYFDVL